MKFFGDDVSGLNQANQKIIEKILKQLRISPTDVAYERKLKNVVLITAEYLPRDITQVSLQCKNLAEGLVQRGINTHVVSFDPWKAGQTTNIGGAEIHYVGNSVKSYSPLTWAITLNMEIGRVVADIYHSEGNIDLIHTHEWQMFPAGITLQSALRKPLISSYYTLQEQRTPGVNNGFTEAVKQIEWRASQASSSIHVNEEWMKSALLQFYSPSESKVNVLKPETPSWAKDVVRDYSWVLKNWDVPVGVSEKEKRDD